MWVPVAPHSCQHLVLSVFWILAIYNNSCTVAPCCCFNLQFPNDIWCWASFHILICHLYIFFGEVSIQITISWVTCTLCTLCAGVVLIAWYTWPYNNLMIKFLFYRKKKTKTKTKKNLRSSVMSKLGSCRVKIQPKFGASLVVQWLRIRLPMQGTQVRAVVPKDPTCHGATKPMRHNYWACSLEPASHNYWTHVPQLLKLACLEPVLCNKRSHRNEKPAHLNEG